MQARVLEKDPGCPFLMSAAVPRGGRFPTPIYCRLPGGRVRIPARDEIVRFCAIGRYRECLTYLCYADPVEP